MSLHALVMWSLDDPGHLNSFLTQAVQCAQKHWAPLHVIFGCASR